MNIDHTNPPGRSPATLDPANDQAELAKASLFRKVRALSRAMGKRTDWYRQGVAIRSGHTFSALFVQCPLTVVGNESGAGASAAFRSGRKMGFDERDSCAIMSAADHDTLHLSKPARKLRRILLRSARLPL